MTAAAEARLIGQWRDPVDRAIAAATEAVLALQRPDGHWVFELEADATIPSEYVLLVHYLGEPPNPELERKIGAYLRRIRGAHGGWPLYHDGPFDLSATVTAPDDWRCYRYRLFETTIPLRNWIWKAS